MKRMLPALKRLAVMAVVLLASVAPGEPSGKPPAPAKKPSSTTAKAEPTVVDICTDAVDPYNPSAQRTLFFKAAGPDNEMSAKEFAADRAKSSGGRSSKSGAAAGFARRQ